VPLAPWWPRGFRSSEFALIVEGEGDALAAESTKGEALDPLAVVGLPGAGVAHKALTDDLVAAGVRSAAIALDADEAGRRAAAKLAQRLTAAGIACLSVELPDGFDLADFLAQAPEPTAALSQAIGGAQVYARPITPEHPKTSRRTRQSASFSGRSAERDAAIEDLRSIEAVEYLGPIAGVEPLPGGRVRCPLPDHEDRRPSASYSGSLWFCHRCAAGGNLFDLAAVLTGRSTRGPDFIEVARWAAERLTNNPAAFELPERRSR
jgi:hypothetical protein